MELRGWDYTGRNIGPDFHKQFLFMIDCLSDTSFTRHMSWSNPLQERLAAYMKMSSSGAVRTVKRVCVNFGFLVEESISSKCEIDNDRLLTPRGQLVYQAAKLENQVNDSINYDEATKVKIYSQIKRLYEEAYCSAMMHYFFTNSDGTHLHPLRATLRALERYSRMDKWEWYLLNTCIRHDDNEMEEEAFDKAMKLYRNGDLSFSMSNVVEKPKGHQYIPQYFEFAGLLHVVQRPDWSISDSGKHKKVKEDVLAPDFLNKLYGGELKDE